jgi:UMF1 family MFS transporter
MMVNIGTRLFKSQQGGFAMITILLTIGFFGLLFLRKGNRDLAS